MKLFTHQEKAIKEVEEILERRGICILNGMMRSGKTAIALKAGKGIVERIGGRCLVLTKKKAIKSILSDSLALFGGDNSWLEVINYESCHKIEPSKWSLIVLDESHSSGLSKLGKPGAVWLKVREIFKKSGAKALLMSGTVAIETPAQMYNEVCVTGRGPWLGFGSFFRWWYAPQHYKNGFGGGYGIQDARKRIGGGMETVDYSQVNEEKVWADIKHLIVSVTREDAGFDVIDSKVVKCKIEDKKILEISNKIMKTGVLEIEGRTCLYENGASKLQGAYMALGGTLIDEDGEAFDLPWVPEKMKWIIDGAKEGRQYVVFAHFIKERERLLKELPESTDDFEAFKDGAGKFLVLSMTSYSMGIDLSWISGTMLIYSSSWSGAVWSQVKCRMLKHDRKSPAIIGVPIISGGIDEMVIDAVERKDNFNLKTYRMMN